MVAKSEKLAFEVQDIAPDWLTAVRMRQILLDDFSRLGTMEYGDALSIANPNDKSQVVRQLDRLRRPKGRVYLGAYVTNKLHVAEDHPDNLSAIAMINTWRDGDQKYFGKRAKTALQRFMDGGMQGLHAFAISNDQSITADAFLDQLLQHRDLEGFTTIRKSTELRVPADSEDGPLRLALEARGAQVLGMGFVPLGENEEKIKIRRSHTLYGFRRNDG